MYSKKSKSIRLPGSLGPDIIIEIYKPGTYKQEVYVHHADDENKEPDLFSKMISNLIILKKKLFSILKSKSKYFSLTNKKMS